MSPPADRGLVSTASRTMISRPNPLCRFTKLNRDGRGIRTWCYHLTTSALAGWTVVANFGDSRCASDAPNLVDVHRGRITRIAAADFHRPWQHPVSAVEHRR
jgi:hypothetical protein